MEETTENSPGQLQIDVCPCGEAQSLGGYPNYAKDEAHAHTLAEEAVTQLQQGADPGEYYVVVSQNRRSPVSTQVVVVPSKPG